MVARSTSTALVSRRIVTGPVTPKTSPVKEAPQSTVSLKDIAGTLAGQHGFPVRTMNGLLADFITSVTTHLRKGAKVRVTGLGILQVRKRPARMVRNPRTGESTKAKASKKVTFRAAKVLKEQLQ